MGFPHTRTPAWCVARASAELMSPGTPVPSRLPAVVMRAAVSLPHAVMEAGAEGQKEARAEGARLRAEKGGWLLGGPGWAGGLCVRLLLCPE